MIYDEFDKLISEALQITAAEYDGKKFGDYYKNKDLKEIYSDLITDKGLVSDEASRETLKKFFSILRMDININKNFPFCNSEIIISKDIPKNILFKGVPGTGKSYIIDNIIEYELLLKNKPENICRINIHSASSNADLMQGIAISTENNQVSYKEKQGLVFKHIRKACFSPFEPFVLILEEIQENSLNELIGDLIYLCEETKRAKIQDLDKNEFKSEYYYQELIDLYIEKIKKLQLDNKQKEIVHTVEIPNLVTNGKNMRLIMPDNLFIFCTSNYRDDKKVIEDNLLRRFDVIEVYPKESAIKSKKISEFLTDLNVDIYRIFEAQKEIHPDRFLIGHSNWLYVENIGDDKFYKALLKVVVEFKEVREVDYEIIKELFKKIIKDYSLELNGESYKELVTSLQEKVYLNILNCTEKKSNEHISSQE